ncbi:hypothetical protein ACFRMQ_00155 [Kitasatospora sp. NPDC056783]|uniref:hypothetical protein n=1 Tax=Kitasatospora sp. NPDC056783 TaxID=3345943 RepID=UPI0036C241D6
MTDGPIPSASAGLYTVWEDSVREADRVAIAVLRSALPGAATGTTPDVLLAPVPGGGRITIRLESSAAVVITADRLPVAAAQVLLDDAAQPGWFSALATTDGRPTESLAGADPDEYGEPSSDRVREDTLRVRSDGTADLLLHDIRLRRAVNALHATRAALTTVDRSSASTPAGNI